jgi:hypothetical protein
VARGISLEKVEEAIRAAENEREIRRRMFAQEPKRQHMKVREMNVILDVLRWSRRFLLIPGERPRDEAPGDGHWPRPLPGIREPDRGGM